MSMIYLTLYTPRLELIAATAESTHSEMHNIAALAAALDVVLPTSWPPPLHDAETQAWYLDLLKQDGAVGSVWYVILPQSERQLAGMVGFKGKPRDGSCEIGYNLLPGFEGFGYATEATQRLIKWSFEQPDVEEVTGETLPDLARSIRVMEKCRMRFVGEGAPEGDTRTSGMPLLVETLISLNADQRVGTRNELGETIPVRKRK